MCAIALWGNIVRVAQRLRRRSDTQADCREAASQSTFQQQILVRDVSRQEKLSSRHARFVLRCWSWVGGPMMSIDYRRLRRQFRVGSSVAAQTAALGMLLCAAAQEVSAAEHPRRIYFLESLSPTLPAAVLTIRAFKQRLSERTAERFEIFADYMELVRLPSQAHIDSTVRYLSQKYAEAPPDILIPLGRAAIPFLMKYRDVIAPNVPTIIANVPSGALSDIAQLKNVFSVATQYSFAKTAQLAEQLQPNAKAIAVIGGSSDYDRTWLEDARRQLEPYAARHTIKYIAGLPYDEILKQVSALSSDTIAIMSFVFVDGSGQARVQTEVAANVARASGAPLYSPISSLFGNGIVGGYMDSWEAHGVAAADLAFEILSGKNLAAIPQQNIPLHTYRVDERQLKRWKISSARVPLGADVEFREFNMWDRYRWQIVGIVAVLLLQAAVITWLYLEHRRRRALEMELRRRLLEVMHLNSTAVAGALSASVAHELNQPLGAIQSYAEAAAIYLKNEPPNIERVEQILASIRRDDRRAADIIKHFRGLLKKRDEVELQEFDFNDLVRDTLEIVRPEAVKRGVMLTSDQAAGPLTVRGDRVHLQQVILNLALNGIDAMQNCPPGHGRMSIKTARVDEAAMEVSVTDSGMGIPKEKLSKIFDAFYTTKRQGTGLGLSIARTIVETYGGKIRAENRLGGGATVSFTLPLSVAFA